VHDGNCSQTSGLRPICLAPSSASFPACVRRIGTRRDGQTGKSALLAAMPGKGPVRDGANQADGMRRHCSLPTFSLRPRNEAQPCRRTPSLGEVGMRQPRKGRQGIARGVNPWEGAPTRAAKPR